MSQLWLGASLRLSEFRRHDPLLTFLDCSMRPERSPLNAEKWASAATV